MSRSWQWAILVLSSCYGPSDVDCPHWTAPEGTYVATGFPDDIHGTAVIRGDQILLDYEDTDGNRWRAVYKRGTIDHVDSDQ